MIDDFRTYTLTEDVIEVGDEEIERDATSRRRDGRVSRGRASKFRSPARFKRGDHFIFNPKNAKEINYNKSM